MKNKLTKDNLLNLIIGILIGVAVVLIGLLIFKMVNVKKVDEDEKKKDDFVVVVEDNEVVSDKDSSGTDNNEEIKKEYILDSSEKSDKLEKVYDEKSIVYDAEYKYESTYELVGPTDYSVYKDYVDLDVTNLSGIKVPYINIKSNNATKANQTLKHIYLETMKALEGTAKCIEDTPDYPCGANYLNYIKFESDKVVSVVVFYGSHATDIPHTQYITYSFDKKTGNYLGVDEIAKKENLTVEKLKEKTNSAISIKVDELDVEYADDTKPFGTYKDDTIKNFEDGFNNYEYNCVVRNNSLCFQGVQYYYDNDDKLHALVTIHMSYGFGKKYWDIEI